MTTDDLTYDRRRPRDHHAERGGGDRQGPRRHEGGPARRRALCCRRLRRQDPARSLVATERMSYRTVLEAGFGPAFHQALMTPTEAIVATVDADDTYPAEQFPQLIVAVRNGYDVAGTDRLAFKPDNARCPDPTTCVNRAAVDARIGPGPTTTIRDVHSGQRGRTDARLSTTSSGDTTNGRFPDRSHLHARRSSATGSSEFPIEYAGAGGRHHARTLAERQGVAQATRQVTPQHRSCRQEQRRQALTGKP